MGKHDKNQMVKPDFQSSEREQLIRKYSKSIRFNKKEMDVLNDYFERFNIHSKSAFFREAIMMTVLKSLDENYPEIF